MTTKVTYKPRNKIFDLDELIEVLTEARKLVPGNSKVRVFNNFRGAYQVDVDGTKLVDQGRMDTD